MAQPVVDLYVLYRIVKDISTPFKETEAFKLGLIDDKGKRLKKASTSEEKEAMNYYNRFVFNIKRIMGRVGLDSKIATYAGALLLLKETKSDRDLTDEEIVEGLNENMDYLSQKTNKSFKDLLEDAPAMSTGPAVAGTGDDPVHWKKMGRPRVKGKAIDGVAYLKRMNKIRAANNVVSKVR
jgi:hypothetical protein